MRTIIAALLISVATLPAVAQDVSGARDASAKFTAALASGDAQTAASFLTDDAVVLPPGRPPINGKAQIQQFLGNMTRMVKNLKYTPEDVKPIDETTVREVGTFGFKLRDNDVEGKYLLGLDQGRQRLEGRGGTCGTAVPVPAARAAAAARAGPCGTAARRAEATTQ